MKNKNRKPDTPLADAIRKLQAEIDEKALILKALREQYDASEIDYYEYLKTEAWQAQRLRVFRRDGFKCVCCGAAKNLDVHHITYKRLGAEELEDLATLCRTCHEKVHNGELQDLPQDETKSPGSKSGLSGVGNDYQLLFSEDEFNALAWAVNMGDKYFEEEDKLVPEFFKNALASDIIEEFNESRKLPKSIDLSIQIKLQNESKTDDPTIIRAYYLAYHAKMSLPAVDNLELFFLQKIKQPETDAHEKADLFVALTETAQYKRELRERLETL